MRIDNANSKEIQGKVEKHGTWSAARAHETLATGRKKIQKSQEHKKKIIKKSAARAYGVIDNRQKKKVKSLKKT